MENNAWVNFTITRGPIQGAQRNRVGLIFRIQARRDVEDFMAGLAQGRRLPLEALGESYWQNCGTDGGVLEYYDADIPSDNPRIYALNRLGEAPLVITNERQAQLRGVPADEVVNLSFLRLVGIGEESGVSVGLVGAYSADYAKRLRGLIPAALKQFLHDYMIPVTINIQVISRSE